MKPVVLGLDLSLRRTAAIVIPYEWDFEWRSLKVCIVGGDCADDLRDQHARVEGIVDTLLDFATRHRATHAFFEQHSFSKGLMAYAMARAELVGVVKWELERHCRMLAVPVVASSARKLLFGKLPAKDAKKHAVARVTAMGCPLTWKDDEVDATVVANFGRHLLGLPALATTE